MSKRRMFAIGSLAAGAALSMVAAARSERVVFEERIAGEIDAMLAAANPPRIGQVTETDHKTLPEPVRRW
jgi:hypothetical protein